LKKGEGRARFQELLKTVLPGMESLAKEKSNEKEPPGGVGSLKRAPWGP